MDKNLNRKFENIQWFQTKSYFWVISTQLKLNHGSISVQLTLNHANIAEDITNMLNYHTNWPFFEEITLKPCLYSDGIKNSSPVARTMIFCCSHHGNQTNERKKQLGPWGWVGYLSGGRSRPGPWGRAEGGRRDTTSSWRRSRGQRRTRLRRSWLHGDGARTSSWWRLPWRGEQGGVEAVEKATASFRKPRHVSSNVTTAQNLSK